SLQSGAGARYSQTAFAGVKRKLDHRVAGSILAMKQALHELVETEVHFSELLTRELVLLSGRQEDPLLTSVDSKVCDARGHHHAQIARGDQIVSGSSGVYGRRN